MSSIAGAACALRNEGFFRDRRLLRAEARRRRKRFTLLGARRRIAVVSEASGTAAEDSDSSAAPFACRLRSCKQPKEQKTLGTKTTKAPFRPPSRDPSPRLATSNYVTFREQHRKYYNSIRHTFIANASSAGSGGDRHARCKTSNATCQHSGRPPWDDSTKVSFAPEGFKALIPVRRTTRKASVRLKKDDSAEDEASFSGASECENAAEPKGADPLLGFSFLFKPYSFSFLSPSKSTSKDKSSAEKDAPASVGKAGNERKEQLPPKKNALASVGNIESASQDTKLGGSRRRHLASKENKPPVESRSSTKSNALSKKKEANSSFSSPVDKKHLKSRYNFRQLKRTSHQPV